MPSAQPDLNKSTGIISSQFNSVTQPFQVSIFSTQNQDLSGSTKYPQQPTLAPITPTVATSKDGEIGKSTYQINGVTQATISSFPFITPTSSSQMHSGEVYEYTKPDQGLQKENTRESNSEVVKQSSLQSPREEDPIKPQINENTQFGQEYPTPSTSSFGQPTTPFIFSPQTGSIFAKQPISQPQLGSQSSFLFGQPTTLSRFDALTTIKTTTNQLFTESKHINSPIQTSLSYGQKPTQGKIMEQTSFSFGSQTTPSRFGAITSTSFNQQTTPSPSRVQTSSTFGQKTTRSQFADTSFSLGSQTTSSRFGDQTSPSLGQKSSGQTNLSFESQTTPSRFGAVISTSLNQQTTPSSLSIPSSVQTSSTFEQTTIQSQPGGQTSVSFGSQTIPSHSAVPISTSFGQRTTPSRLGIQSSLSTAQEIIPSPFPSHFGVQASSTFEPKPTQSQLDGQTGVSFGLQTTLSRFGAPVTTSFGQQTTPSRSGVQSSLSTAQQTTPSTLSPTGALFGQKITPSLLNIPTGSVSGQQTTPSKTGAQSSSFTSQQLTTSPFSEQTSSAFGQKIIPSRFYNSTSEQQSITQIGDGQRKNENSVGTQLQESNKQSETQSDFKPLPSLAITSNSEESSDEIYQYNKPTTSFPSNDGNNTQLNFGLQPSQAINQLGQQSNGLIEANGITLGQLFDDKQSQLFGIKPNNQFGLKAEQPNNQQLQGTHLDQQSVLQSEEESFSALTKTEVASQQNQHYQEKTPPRFSQQQKVTNLPFASQTTLPSITPTSSSEQSFDSKE
ncbi:jg11316, partial [Pararge aegeria aegeria]